MGEETTPSALEPWEVRTREIVQRVAPPLALALQFLGTLAFRTLVSIPVGWVLALVIRQLQPDLQVWPAALAVAASMALKPASQASWSMWSRMRADRRGMADGKRPSLAERT